MSSITNEINLVLLGVFDLGEAKRIQKELEEKNVETELRTNEQTCTRGCKVTVELWANGNKHDQLVEFFQKEQLRDLQGHEINFEHLSAVFDENADEVTCQACGAKFSPKEHECPECGLCY